MILKKLAIICSLLVLSGTAMAVPITVADLGSVRTQSVTGTLNPRFAWYSFEVGDLTRLIINTIGSSFDTELGLYDALGNRVRRNDDAFIFGAPGCGIFCSRLVFGPGLSSGTYYLALGRYNTRFRRSDFDVRGSGVAGSYRINFITDNPPIGVPEPGTLGLLGLSLLAIGARRRKRV